MTATFPLHLERSPRRPMAKPIEDTGFAQRLFRAWYLFQLKKGGSATQEWLGKQVGKMLPPKEPLSQSAVSRWMKGARPELETIAAIAAVLQVDPGWLAFGGLSAAPAPEDPFRDRLRPANGGNGPTG